VKVYELKDKVKIIVSMEDKQQMRINKKRSKNKIAEPHKQLQIAVVEYFSLSSSMKIFLFPRLIPKTIWDIL